MGSKSKIKRVLNPNVVNLRYRNNIIPLTALFLIVTIFLVNYFKLHSYSVLTDRIKSFKIQIVKDQVNSSSSSTSTSSLNSNTTYHKKVDLDVNVVEVKNNTDLHINIQNIKQERESVIKDNVDEDFLTHVKSKIEIKEIDLLAENILEKFVEFDAEIEQDFKKITQGLGADAGEIDFEQFDRDLLDQMNKMSKIEGFNSILSEKISLQRSIPDARPVECKIMGYEEDLPTISIIIRCNNEPMSSFMRTLFSIVNRTPAKLLKEIIIIDDSSTRKEISNGKLERFLVTQFPTSLVRLVRLNTTVGLIKCRLIGAHLSTGDVLFFSDVLMEFGFNWAQPLVQRIKYDRTRVTCPTIDQISPVNLKYYFDKSKNYIFGFQWDGVIIPIEPSEFELERKRLFYAPTRSPVLKGDAFAIERKYFWEMGSYDVFMNSDGSELENLEFSLRISMCGGTTEILPCSRVGLLYRVKSPINYNSIDDYYEDYVNENSSAGLGPYNGARIAKIWMDQFQNLYFRSHPSWKDTDVGETKSRRELRERLKCKSFKWYMDNVYKEKFQEDFSDDTLSTGQFQSIENPNTCIDIDGQGQDQNQDNSSNYNYDYENGNGNGNEEPVKDYYDYKYDENNSHDGVDTIGSSVCYEKNQTTSSQILFIMKGNELRILDSCLGTGENDTVSTVECPTDLKNAKHIDKWEYSKKTMQIINYCTRKCISLVGKKLYQLDCLDHLVSQQWKFLPISY